MDACYLENKGKGEPRRTAELGAVGACLLCLEEARVSQFHDCPLAGVCHHSGTTTVTGVV